MRKRILCATALFSLAVLLGYGAQRSRAQETEKKQTAEKPQTESAVRRVTMEPRITKVLYLPGFLQPVEMQDVTNALRTMTDTGFRVYQFPAASTIVISGTQEQIKLAESIVDELDKSKARSVGNYRVDFRIAELENGKKLDSRAYSLLVRPGAPGKIHSTAKLANSGNSETGNRQLQQFEVGPDIECNVRATNDKAVVLSIELELFAMLGGSSSQAQADSPVRQFKSAGQIELEWGKPTLINSFDDPISKRSLQIEVTATRLIPKP